MNLGELGPRRVKRWPWFLRWLEPHHAEDKKRILFQCACGRVFWNDAPQEVKKLHQGDAHRFKVCERSSLWNFVKMKFGLLDRLTWSERLQVWEESRHCAP
jgi:hypothetical protein